MTNIKKIIAISGGCIFLSLGVVGIFLPLVPTTPFLLLAAGCFLHSSKRLYTWLISHRILGNYIRYYLQYRAIPLKAKILKIILLWTSIGYCIMFITDVLWIRIVLLMIAICVTVRLVTMKTLTPEMRNQEPVAKDT